MKTLLLSGLVLASTFVASAAGQEGLPDPAKLPPGPSMVETKTWLETEAPGLLRAQQSRTDSTLGPETRSQTVQSLKFDACRLTVVYDVATNMRMLPGTPGRETMSMPMKDLDVGGTVVAPTVGFIDNASFSLTVKVRASTGKTISEDYPGQPTHARDQFSLLVSNQSDGQRVASAVKRAGILCGAPAGPF